MHAARAAHHTRAPPAHTNEGTAYDHSTMLTFLTILSVNCWRQSHRLDVLGVRRACVVRVHTHPFFFSRNFLEFPIVLAVDPQKGSSSRRLVRFKNEAHALDTPLFRERPKKRDTALASWWLLCLEICSIRDSWIKCVRRCFLFTGCRYHAQNDFFNFRMCARGCV